MLEMNGTLVRNNYYEILELSVNCAQHEVTTAYERARKTYSGDNPAIYTIFSEKEARDLLKLIEEAYSVLGNKTLRSLYDQRLLAKAATTQDLTYDSLLNASKQNLPEKKQAEQKHTYKMDDAIEKEITSKLDWNGSDLKRVREYKSYSLEKLSEITKINSFYINAIEIENPADLPALVFVRGYVVQIAKTLGLNSKNVADSYMKNFKLRIN